MEPIGGWHLVFYFGNFLSDIGIALFAIRASYADINLDKLSKRYSMVNLLALKSTEIAEDKVETVHGIINGKEDCPQAVSAEREVNQEEALKKVFDDKFISTLPEGLFPEDMEGIISTDLQTAKKSLETITPCDLRWRIYQNRTKLGPMVEKASEDLRKHKDNPFNKYALNHKLILSLFLVGIIIQFVSLTASILGI